MERIDLTGLTHSAIEAVEARLFRLNLIRLHTIDVYRIARPGIDDNACQVDNAGHAVNPDQQEVKAA
ncbi:hypothetical protein ABN028_19830 [Actinopolymorpha sp. B17G11]|uniref:hypothetical protein n=1 Tax=Actinopolymorpha sp. B17G11 TaxID=3160861 RepID=UPI0032E52906